MVKNPPANAGDLGSIMGQEDPLEKGMATHSSILACRIPWTEEPGGLPSMGLQRVGHNRVTKHVNVNTLDFRDLVRKKRQNKNFFILITC